MEENQVPNSNPEQFNVAGNGKKKKGMGPLGGCLLAILLVFLICVIGLLIRMVVAGDGDYFKPIKSIFGIEEEEEETKSDKKAEITTSSKTGKSSVASGARYALLSDDVDGKDVKHYRLTIDMGEFFGKMMEELNTISNEYNSDTDDYYYDDEDYTWDDSDFNWDDWESEYEDEDYYYDDSDYDYNESDALFSSFGNIESMMGMAMMLMSEMADKIDGEMYFDIYFEGNDIIQVVIGYDYAKFIDNLYEYMLEESEDELEEEGIKSADDLAKMVADELDKMLDEDALYEMMTEDEEFAASLSEMGIKEKDVKEAIDFYNEDGVFEIYLNGTTKIKGLISMVLDGEDFQSELEAMEDETGVKIDEDNIIESILKAANESEDSSELGLEFVEVK